MKRVKQIGQAKDIDRYDGGVGPGQSAKSHDRFIGDFSTATFDVRAQCPPIKFPRSLQILCPEILNGSHEGAYVSIDVLPH